MSEDNLENETPKNEGEAEPEITPEEGGEAPKKDTELEITPDELEEIKKKAALAEAYKIRAEKSESKLKEFKDKDTSSISAKDALALVSAKVDAEDYDDIAEWAKFKKVSISEALKDKKIQVLLREKSEERKTANATLSRKSGAVSKETPEAIVDRARKGELPTDDDDIAIRKLAEAQWTTFLKSKKSSQ